MIELNYQRLGYRECLNDSFTHLRPLGTLTSENEPNFWSIGILLSERECSLVDVSIVSYYISSVEVATSALRESIC